MTSVTPSYPVLWHYTATIGTRTYTFRSIDRLYTEFSVYNSSSSTTEILDRNTSVIPLPPSPSWTPTTRSGSVCSVNTFYLMTWNSCPCPITPTISSQTNVSCNGLSNGSVSISPNGGSSPYTYSWGGSNSVTAASTGTITGLAAGSYVVTVSDPNCSTVIGVNITEPAPITIDVYYRPSNSGEYNISSNGGSDGSIRTLVQGGSAPYSYNWTGPSSASGS